MFSPQTLDLVDLTLTFCLLFGRQTDCYIYRINGIHFNALMLFNDLNAHLAE